LLNIYYETADNWLRRHDMGLRIRGFDGQYEMTMKIAGRVVGGLHQRPEYNIALDKPELDLARFPQEVWPDGALPEDLRAQTQPLFSTDFYREKWLVNVGESRIEIGLDLGEVKAGELAEPICELELELLSGDPADILKLARQLVTQSGLRQGSLSRPHAAIIWRRVMPNVIAARRPYSKFNRKPQRSRLLPPRWSWTFAVAVP
jgi:triphosphatase